MSNPLGVAPVRSALHVLDRPQLGPRSNDALSGRPRRRGALLMLFFVLFAPREWSLIAGRMGEETNNGLGGTRTHNQRLKRALLYH